jgi:hypothetical protein
MITTPVVYAYRRETTRTSTKLPAGTSSLAIAKIPLQALGPQTKEHLMKVIAVKAD